MNNPVPLHVENNRIAYRQAIKALHACTDIGRMQPKESSDLVKTLASSSAVDGLSIAVVVGSAIDSKMCHRTLVRVMRSWGSYSKYQGALVCITSPGVTNFGSVAHKACVWSAKWMEEAAANAECYCIVVFADGKTEVLR